MQDWLSAGKSIRSPEQADQKWLKKIDSEVAEVHKRLNDFEKYIRSSTKAFNTLNIKQDQSEQNSAAI